MPVPFLRPPFFCANRRPICPPRTHRVFHYRPTPHFFSFPCVRCLQVDFYREGNARIRLTEPVCRPGTSTSSGSAPPPRPSKASLSTASAAPPRRGKTGLSAEAEATLYGLAGDATSMMYQLVEGARIKKSAAENGYENVKYNLRAGYENTPGGAAGNVYDLLADLNLDDTPENQDHAHIYAEISLVREEIYASALARPGEGMLQLLRHAARFPTPLPCGGSHTAVHTTQHNVWVCGHHIV